MMTYIISFVYYLYGNQYCHAGLVVVGPYSEYMRTENVIII